MVYEIAIKYPRKVIGGRMTGIERRKMKSGPRLKTVFMENNFEITDNAAFCLNVGMQHLKKVYDDVINRPNKVQIVADKLRMNQYFEVMKIPHFPTWHNWKDVPNRKRIIIKKRHSRCGKGKEIFDNKKKVPKEMRDDPSYYFQLFLPIDREYRCYAVLPDYIGLFGKSGGRGEIRNEQFGWRFRRQITLKDRHPKIWNLIKRMSLNAINNMGLHFAGVDIAQIQRDDFRIIEINSASFLRDPEASAIVNLTKKRWFSNADLL